jgi:hypothetical protein
MDQGKALAVSNRVFAGEARDDCIEVHLLRRLELTVMPGQAQLLQREGSGVGQPRMLDLTQRHGLGHAASVLCRALRGPGPPHDPPDACARSRSGGVAGHRFAHHRRGPRSRDRGPMPGGRVALPSSRPGRRTVCHSPLPAHEGR